MGSFLRMKLVTIFSLILVVTLALFGTMRFTTHAAATSITLSVNSGPPTTAVTVNGTGFGSSEMVTLAFDTTSVDTSTTDSNGAFTSQITIPSSAAPGNHSVSVTGQTSGLSAQATFLVQTNWEMFGYDPQHTHYNPFENVLTTSNVSRLTLDWYYSTGSTVYASPAVVGGKVYVTSYDGKLYVFDAATGDLVWSFTTATSGYNMPSSPAVVNGIVYFGAGYADDNIYALNANTGALLWSYYTGSPMTSSPVVSNGVVYIGVTNTDKLYALNANTGAFIWSYQMPSNIECSPAVANGIVYIGSDNPDHKLYAVNAITGKLVWKHGMSNDAPYSLSVVNDIVYVGVQITGKFYAFDAISGTLKWLYATGSRIDSSPAVANGVVYIGLDNGSLLALNATTGILQWSYDASINSKYAFYSSPAIANGIVYDAAAGLNAKMIALDATTGILLWTYKFGKGISTDSSPAVANGAIYIGTGSGWVFAFHLPGMTP